MANWKDILRPWIPPAVLAWRRPRIHEYSGDYASWAEAAAQATGYDAANILEKVRQALLAVKAGKAVFERDSVLFYKQDYNWPLLACLLRAASSNGNRLNVIDFGGSLGSGYFQHRNYLSFLNELSWEVVEQGNFVTVGRADFADHELSFHERLADCHAATSGTALVLLSSVLPYVENPLAILRDVFASRPAFVLIDRTPLLDGAVRDRLTVQTVSPNVYRASYPAWFFARQSLLDAVPDDYEMVAEFVSYTGTVDLVAPEQCGRYLGFLFSRRSTTIISEDSP